MSSSRADPRIENTGERHLRNASIIDQGRLNAHPVAVIGVGAIGSHLAEMLVKLGVQNLTLIDFDEVDEVNLGVQGFYEIDVGRPKVEVVAGRLRSINSGANVTVCNEQYRPGLIESGSAVCCCVDSIRTRRQIFHDYRTRDWCAFLDGRMAAESLHVFTIDRSAEATKLYRVSLFPEHEAQRESCTARATVYCASMAAAVMVAQFKKWAMGQAPEFHLAMDLISMDIFR